MKRLRVATRGSALALWQAQHVADRLRAMHPGLMIELVRIKTTGDKILDVPLAKVGGKGLFTKEIEEALLDQRADIAVHSMKDVPTVLPEGLELRCILKREDPRDALATVTGGDLASLPQDARIGTSSLRRICQLKAQHPHFRFVPIRGNVETRLNKLGKDVDAVVLAAAGVKRLGIEHRMHAFFSTDEMLPAVAQGAIGVEARVNDAEVHHLIDGLHHEPTGCCVEAERAFLARLEGGCQVPIAGFARIAGEELIIQGLVGDVNGQVVIRKEIRGKKADAKALGQKLADRILDAGGREILKRLYEQS